MVTGRHGALPSGSLGLKQTTGDEITFNVRTDHINIAAIGNAGSGVSSSFQIYAELTNINEQRMGPNYISGSGVNIF